MSQDGDAMAGAERPPEGLGLVTSLRATGRGIIVLAGPSSCGKGAVAQVLSETLHLREDRHLSMGDVLRRSIVRGRKDAGYRTWLETHCTISEKESIYDAARHDEPVVAKARSYNPELEKRYGERPSELDWLEYCVHAGLLVPDLWSERLIEGAVEEHSKSEEAVILLDGYPRTEVAARHLLSMSSRYDMPILKVLHLSVSKSEMLRRALGRQRVDDTPEMLERRYSFYVDQVQPAVELLKSELGAESVALIDAHQPAHFPEGGLNLQQSVRNVARSALASLGVSRHILRNLEEWRD